MAMNYEVNKLYGILVNGDVGTTDNRQSSTSRATLSSDARKIVEALIPSDLDKDTKRALAELYIRLIYTDKSMIAALKVYDPINSYTLHTFYNSYNDGFELERVVRGVRALGLPGEEVSFLPVDYILNALKQLLSLLNG